MANNEPEKKFSFTKKQVEAIQPTNKRRYFFDSVQKGLRLCVTPAGNKSYQFQAWSSVKGAPVSNTLGKFGDISISVARKRAAVLLLEVTAGHDPEKAKQAARAEKTLNEIFPDYLETYAKAHKKTWGDDEKNYERYLRKQLGAKKVSTITTNVIKRWHAKLGKTHGKYTANRSLALLSTIFTNSLNRKTPLYSEIKKFKEQSRERFLSQQELLRFFEALQQERDLFNDFFHILLFTGARKMNVLAMEWSEIREDIWIIPAHKAKAEEPIAVPLLPEVMEILNRREASSKSDFVFPGRGKTGHLADPKAAWRRIIKRADLNDVRIHDLRRTMGSFQAATGANTAVIGKSLGHRSTAATRIYTRLDMDPVRSSMTAAVAAMKKGGKDAA